jgi:hypothetical protein
MIFFHDEVLFENWTGEQAKGGENLRKAWPPGLRTIADFDLRRKKPLSMKRGGRSFFAGNSIGHLLKRDTREGPKGGEA